MDFLTGMRVSSSGMSAQRQRMNTIASNIANVNTTKAPEGGPYRRKDIVFEAIPEARSFGQVLTDQVDRNIHRVQVTDVIPDSRGPRMVYDPHHPDANDQGYVAYPNINITEEMTNMIQATRAYEANVSAMSATKSMASSALDIAR